MNSAASPSVHDHDTAYRRNQVKSIAFLILLTAVLCGAFVLSLCSGSYDTPVGELLKGIFGLSRFRQVSAEGIVQAGVAISAMFTGATALLQYFADEIQPKVLLLDEPTSALDIQNQYLVLEIVREICKTEGITAIVVIHDLNLALRFCDGFLLMRQGKVYRCGGREILDRKALLDVYKINAQITQVMGRDLIIVD